MKVKMISTTSNKINEDVCGNTKYAYFVIDGATGIENKIPNTPSDAHWFVGRLLKHIKKEIDQLSIPIDKIIEEAVLKVRGEYLNLGLDIDSLSYPSATISLVRINKDVLEMFYMGDSSIIIETSTGVFEFKDQRTKPIEQRTLNSVKQYKTKHHLSMEEAVIKSKEQLKENKKLKNKAYFVLSEEIFTEEAYQKTMHVKEVQKVLIASDGFMRIHDVFCHYDSLENLLVDADKEGIGYIVNLITEYENNDKECNFYPRVKPSDDVSAILLTDF